MIKEQIRERLKVGDVFQSPEGETSTITSIDEDFIEYRRGVSNIRVEYSDIERVYHKFQGRIVSSLDLREFLPGVFDSRRNGHGCNCAFVFRIFEKIGLTFGDLKGKGELSNPYKVRLKVNSDGKDRRGKGFLNLLNKKN